LNRPNIYTDKVVIIAGEKFSLDDMEHGVLRKYRYKKSLGYLPNIFAPTFIKELAVETIDQYSNYEL